MNIAQKIRSAIDKGIFACGVYIDLQKPFHKVNHSILLYKLDYYGIRCLAKMRLKSFLKRRNQNTNIKGKSSCKLIFTHGVSEGSVLGLCYSCNI